MASTKPNKVSEKKPSNIQRLDLTLDPSKKEERVAQMNEAVHSYEERFGGLDLETSYMPLFKALWYSTLPCSDIKGVTSEVKGELSFLKKCYWKEREVDCNKIFQKRPTNHGMCCSFNMKKAEELLRTSRYQKAISLRQQEDLESGFESSDKTKWFNDSNEPETEGGIDRGLQLIVDGHSNVLSLASVSDDFRGFPIIVEDNTKFPMMGGDIARPGFQNNI